MKTHKLQQWLISNNNFTLSKQYCEAVLQPQTFPDLAFDLLLQRIYMASDLLEHEFSTFSMQSKSKFLLEITSSNIFKVQLELERRLPSLDQTEVEHIIRLQDWLGQKSTSRHRIRLLKHFSPVVIEVITKHFLLSQKFERHNFLTILTFWYS